jgi:hypothetical protein
MRRARARTTRRNSRRRPCETQARGRARGAGPHSGGSGARRTARACAAALRAGELWNMCHTSEPTLQLRRVRKVEVLAHAHDQHARHVLLRGGILVDRLPRFRPANAALEWGGVSGVSAVRPTNRRTRMVSRGLAERRTTRTSEMRSATTMPVSRSQTTESMNVVAISAISCGARSLRPGSAAARTDAARTRALVVECDVVRRLCEEAEGHQADPACMYQHRAACDRRAGLTQTPIHTSAGSAGTAAGRRWRAG